MVLTYQNSKHIFTKDTQHRNPRWIGVETYT